MACQTEPSLSVVGIDPAAEVSQKSWFGPQLPRGAQPKQPPQSFANGSDETEECSPRPRMRTRNPTKESIHSQNTARSHHTGETVKSDLTIGEALSTKSCNLKFNARKQVVIAANEEAERLRNQEEHSVEHFTAKHDEELENASGEADQPDRMGSMDFNSHSNGFLTFAGVQQTSSLQASIVSNDEELRSAVQWVLQLLGCKQAKAFSSSNVTVIAQLTRGDFKSDLIFCDLGLGLSLLKGLQTVLATGSPNGEPKLPAVVLICDRVFDRQQLSACLEAGAESYVMKPLRIQALRGVASKYIHKQAAAQQLDREAQEADDADAAGAARNGGQQDGDRAGYQKKHCVGRGAAGIVWLVKRKRDDALFALKEISIAKLNFNEQQRVLNEMRLHRSFRCPCICRVYSSWLQDNAAQILMEYVEQGSLRDLVDKLVKQGKTIPDLSIMEWGAQILFALSYLHNKAVLHRDLKLENILGPDNLGVVKLTDFGVAKRLQASVLKEDVTDLSVVGTAYILAPERVTAVGPSLGADWSDGDGRASDMWSLGVVLYELIALRPPFGDPIAENFARTGQVPEEEQVQDEVGSRRAELYKHISSLSPEPLPYGRDAALHKLVTGGLLQKRPQDRPTAADLCKDDALGSALVYFLKRRQLLNHPSVLEVLDVLPPEQNGPKKNRVECSDLDVVSFFTSRQQTGGAAIKLNRMQSSLGRELHQRAAALERTSWPRNGLLAAQQAPALESITDAREDEVESGTGSRINSRVESHTGSRIVSRATTSLVDPPADDVEEQPLNLMDDLQNRLDGIDAGVEEQLQQMRSTCEQLRADLEASAAELRCMQRPVEVAQRQTEMVAAYIKRRGVLHPWSMRFTSSSLEEDFVQACRRQNAIQTVFCAAIIAAVSGFSIAAGEQATWLGGTAGRLVWSTQWCILAATLAASSMVGAIMAPLACKIRRCWWWICEIVAMLLVNVSVVAIVALHSPYYASAVARVFDLTTNPRNDDGFAEEESCECVALLIFAFVLSVMPKAMPVRWCVQCVVHVVLLLLCLFLELFATGGLLCGPREDIGPACMRVALLCAFAAAALMERRSVEHGMRLEFFLVRNQASPSRPFQRQLARNFTASTTGRRMRRSASQSSVPSLASGTLASSSRHVKFMSKLSQSTLSLTDKLPASKNLRRSETTNTEALFKAFEEAEDEVSRTISLQSIEEYGAKERWLLEGSAVRVVPQKQLGVGGFGVVLEGELYGAPIALKLPKKAAASGEVEQEKNRNNLANELRVLRRVWHPNIVIFYGCTIDPGSHEIMLVLELLKGDQLDSFCCRREDAPSTAMRRKIALDISRALRYLHAQQPCVVHGDLKGSNILVEFWDSGPRAKLLDFGLSRLLTRNVSPLGGTVRWMAPEVVRNRTEPPSPSADVFSYGRLAYLIVTGRQPLRQFSCEEIVQAVQRAEVLPLAWPKQGPLVKECKALVEKCLSCKAFARPDMNETHEMVKQWKAPEDRRRLSIHGSVEPIAPKPAGKSVPWEEGMMQMNAYIQKEHMIDSLTRSARFWAASERWLRSTFGQRAPGKRATSVLTQIMAQAKSAGRLIDTSRISPLVKPSSTSRARSNLSTNSPHANLIQSCLHVGASSIVMPAELEGSLAALRVPQTPLSGSATDGRMDFVLFELQALLHVRHPNIAACHGLCFDMDKCLAVPVLEWVEGISLESYVRPLLHPQGQKLETRSRLLGDICSALSYLHVRRPPVAHGGLNGSNILVEARLAGPRAKILDISLSRLLLRYSRQSFGPRIGSARRERKYLAYTPPELLNNSGTPSLPQPSADVFAFGRLCYLIVSGQKPFEGVDSRLLERAARRREAYPLSWPSGTLPLLACCQPMAERCMNPHELARPEIVEVQQEIRHWQLDDASEPVVSDTCGPLPALPSATDSLSRWISEATNGIHLQPGSLVEVSEIEIQESAQAIEMGPPTLPYHRPLLTASGSRRSRSSGRSEDHSSKLTWEPTGSMSDEPTESLWRVEGLPSPCFGEPPAAAVDIS